MIRKSFLTILLPILLLLAQQGAIVHELGHLAGNALRAEGREQRHEPQHSPGTTCEKCVVFAHLSGAVTPHVPGFDSLLLAHALSGRTSVARSSADTPVARSRGPPF